MNRTDTGSLWVAHVVAPQGAGRFLIVANSGYVAKVRARQIADEAGLVGRHREVFMTHVCRLPEGTITLGTQVMRRHAADAGFDLDKIDSSYLPAVYVTPFGRYMLDEQVDTCACGATVFDGETADHARCHLIP